MVYQEEKKKKRTIVAQIVAEFASHFGVIFRLCEEISDRHNGSITLSNVLNKFTVATEDVIGAATRIKGSMTMGLDKISGLVKKSTKVSDTGIMLNFRYVKIPIN